MLLDAKNSITFLQCGRVPSKDRREAKLDLNLYLEIFSSFSVKRLLQKMAAACLWDRALLAYF